MQKRTILSFKDRVTLGTWLQANKDTQFKTIEDAAKAFTADTGVVVNTAHVSNGARALGIKLKKHTAYLVSTKCDRRSENALLAKLVRRICDEAGVVLSDDERSYLDRLVARKPMLQEKADA